MRADFETIDLFSQRLDSRFSLRPYQLPPARAVLASVLHGTGEPLAVMFSRQSGKDALLVQTVAYLLRLP